MKKKEHKSQRDRPISLRVLNAGVIAYMSYEARLQLRELGALAEMLRKVYETMTLEEARESQGEPSFYE